LALKREIAEQQDLDSHEKDPGAGYYGKVAADMSAGITRDELPVYESLSGIRLYVGQAELLGDLFRGKVNSFQLQMGGGKTAALICIFCFSVSVPVILSQPSQFESVVDNVGDTGVLDVSRNQLKDIAQLQQILENLRNTKKDHSVIVAKTSLLNVLQRMFQESCDRLSKIDAIESELRMLLNKGVTVLQKSNAKNDELSGLPKSNASCTRGQTEIKALNGKFEQIWKRILKLSKEKVKYNAVSLETERENFVLLRDILGFFKTETTAILDEADMNLNRMEEVNFPSGYEKLILQTQRAAGASLLRQGDNFDLFGLLRNKQAMLSERQFVEHQNILAKHIWEQSISQSEPMTWEEFMEDRRFDLDEFRKLLRGETTNSDPFQFRNPAPMADEDAIAEYIKEMETLDSLAMFRGLDSFLVR
jgi:hypothetical protein